MSVEPVRSPRNPRVARAAGLHRAAERRARGLTLLEGPHLLSEAVAARAAIIEVFGLPDDVEGRRLAGGSGAEWVAVSPEALARIASTEHPRGPVAVLAVPGDAPPTRDALDVFVTDPGNAGTLIRTAAAFGLDVVFEVGAVDPWAPKVLRAGAGAHFRTTVTRSSDPGVGRILTRNRGGVDPGGLGAVLDPGRRWAVVVGTEAGGIPAGVVGEVAVTIPMPGGTESLNAAVAGAIVAYELSRWRARLAVDPVDE